MEDRKPGPRSDEAGDGLQCLMPVARRKRKVRSQGSGKKRQTPSRSGFDARFRHNILGNKSAHPVMTVCDVSEVIRELEKTNGNTDCLERRAVEALKRMPNRDAYVDERSIVAAVIRSRTFLERMRRQGCSVFSADLWTFDMISFNSYQAGSRYDLEFRPCAQTNCLSSCVSFDGDDDDFPVTERRLAECVNADLTKLLLTDRKDVYRLSATPFRHLCVLCTLLDIYTFCTNPVNDHLVDPEDFAVRLAFEFVGISPAYELTCRLETEDGVYLNYKYINIDTALEQLRWTREKGENLYRVDFSPIFKRHGSESPGQKTRG